MRRFLLSAAVLCTLALGQAFGQGVFTGYELSDFQREGTARSVAMGNAMTALGGDLGAIGINPASSGVLRYSQITFSPSLTTNRSTVNYLGNATSALENTDMGEVADATQAAHDRLGEATDALDGSGKCW